MFVGGAEACVGSSKKLDNRDLGRCHPRLADLVIEPESVPRLE